MKAKTVRFITPENVGPNPYRYRAVCRKCNWEAVPFREMDMAETVAAMHVRDSGHTVAIEEDEE